MLNYIWLGLIGLAVLMGSFRGNIGDVGQAGIDGANLALKIAGVLVDFKSQRAYKEIVPCALSPRSRRRYASQG